jgi:hypothetical protein
VNREPAIASAITQVVAGHRLRRVPLRDLLVAAASVDHTAASTVGWRARVLIAIVDLADEGLVELPRTRMDHTAHPPLPAYVTRPAAARPAVSVPETVVWHADLSWAAALDQDGELTVAQRRFLAAVNAWLPTRRDIPVPLRERSLELLGDEKELERWVLGPLFGPGRLSMDQLDCFPCWPPVEQSQLGPGDWLVIENYTTYVSIADRAIDVGFDGRVVWGSGNQVGTRISALIAAGVDLPRHCWYFGDIDAGGFRAARLAVARAAELGLGPVHPARGLYRLALGRGVCRPADRMSAEMATWARTWLGGGLGDAAAEIVGAGQRIVQEHVGVEVLRTVGLAGWFGD